MTTVYHVAHGDGGFYVPTKAEAVSAARAMKDEDGHADPMVSVTRIVVADSLKRRELYCALLNNEGYAVEQTPVEF